MNNKEGSDHQENHNRNGLQMFPQVDGLLLCAGTGLDRTGNGERNGGHQGESNEESVSSDPRQRRATSGSLNELPVRRSAT